MDPFAISSRPLPMMQTIFDRLCGNDALAFESEFSIEESMQRLTSFRVEPDLLGFAPLTAMKLVVVVGRVTEDHVSLWCERLLIFNGLRPVFVGRFQTFDGRVVLIGKLVGMDGHAGQIVGVGLAIGLLIIIGPLLELLRGSHDPMLWLMPLLGWLPPLFTIGVVRLGRWLSSSDENWIIGAIKHALVKPKRTSVA
ncbi:protein of unknown function [Bradyrhizobium sp. ORS 285]|uniref:hypothetical protein n=1 Tax=Bradyrhizobium sp. ORS 285 TaxID=115808 RepID=UPI0002409A7E|nr:hypothetical protein [Bradyrhizobium sp. ORS 285]CCD86960.1 hypothetical protein BRAO285_2130007 [Bradyrhizobium sp. ORS 285]SMX56210.1 protein of unknown function [Bradyrhizobium sp. ORS 285]